MMLDGMCYRHHRLLTKRTGQDSGSWYRPTARDWKGYTRREGESICNQLKKLFPETSGKPHPEFIEEVMGWPIGWSELKPLATDKYQSAQQSPFYCWLEVNREAIETWKKSLGYYR
jgi:hypothetical protein